MNAREWGLCAFLTAVAAGAGAAEGHSVDFAAVKAYCQATWPHPAAQGSFERYSSGFFAENQVAIARHAWAAALLSSARGTEAGLLDYLVARLEGDESFYLGKRVAGGFAERLSSTLRGAGAEEEGVAKLEASEAALGGELYNVFELNTNDHPDAERAQILGQIDVPGKRQAVREDLKAVLAALNSREGAWKPVRDFLSDDARKNRAVAAAAWAEERPRHADMRQSFAEAAKTDGGKPYLSRETVARLDGLEGSVDAASLRVLERGLGPAGVPESVLTTDAGAYAIAVRKYDAAIVGLLSSWVRRGDKDFPRVVDAMYPLWLSMDRQEKRLKRPGLASALDRLDALAAAGDIYFQSVHRDVSTSYDPHTGHPDNEPIAREAGHTLDVILRYCDAWAAHPEKARRLYAAIEVDEAGRRVWRPGGWLRWRWIEPDEMEDLRTDGRVVEGLGRKWLLPAGAEIKSVSSLDDVKASGARELAVALDPRGKWTAAP